MKLFEISCMDGGFHESYLTVGQDNDTEETIKKREMNKRDDRDSLFYLMAREIETVDGYRIIVTEE